MAKGPQPIDITGLRFGSVVVQAIGPIRHYPGPHSRSRRHWLVRCDCGNRYYADGGALRHGRITQCSRCRNVELVAKVKSRAHQTSAGETLWDVARRRGVKADTLTQRVRRGWDPDEAARIPVKEAHHG